MKKRKPNYLLEAIVNIFANLPKGKVLDLGCGNGDYAKRLKDLGFEVIASDMDLERFKYHNLIKFEASNLDKPLPFPDNSFDYVLFLEVIEHLYNPDFVIEQVSRIIKPKGSLFLSTPNILNLGSRIRFLFEGGFDFFREPILDYSKAFPSGLQNMHIIVWRYHELEYLLFKNGLCAENVYTDLMKPALKFWGGALLPLLKFQSWQKERRSGKKGGVDYRRINKIILSKELLFGRHLIIRANKFKLY
ncbi:MAG: methyltransferase domain-containing protein [Candidatus Omnitrophica bacterium]|nr:methyltransferase domain-containing protein [Candidatus Omnitrophota bacterium]